MPLTIIRNDITKMKVDAIVNAANADLKMGGGVCGAIFNAAGISRLRAACDLLSPIKIGESVITSGFDLPAKYIIHAAGPVYNDGNSNEAALLRSCYESALDIAKSLGCESVAFPLISSGTYGYPKAEALEVATGAISGWLMKSDMDVSLVVFDKAAFALSSALLGQVKAFVDENYVELHDALHSRRPDLDLLESMSSDAHEDDKKNVRNDIPDFGPDVVFKGINADEIIRGLVPSEALSFRLDEAFATTLMRLIDSKGRSDVEVYKRANIDRKLFSKIRTGKGYMPSKKTVVALAVGLELSLPETRDLLERAGFALSRSVLFDVIIESFIIRESYDVFEINNVLFEYDQPLLGG